MNKTNLFQIKLSPIDSEGKKEPGNTLRSPNRTSLRSKIQNSCTSLFLFASVAAKLFLLKPKPIAPFGKYFLFFFFFCPKNTHFLHMHTYRLKPNKRARTRHPLLNSTLYTPPTRTGRLRDWSSTSLLLAHPSEILWRHFCTLNFDLVALLKPIRPRPNPICTMRSSQYIN